MRHLTSSATIKTGGRGGGSDEEGVGGVGLDKKRTSTNKLIVPYGIVVLLIRTLPKYISSTSLTAATEM